MCGLRRRPRGWYDLMIAVVRALASVLGDIIRKGGHL